MCKNVSPCIRRPGQKSKPPRKQQSLVWFYLRVFWARHIYICRERGIYILFCIKKKIFWPRLCARLCAGLCAEVVRIVRARSRGCALRFAAQPPCTTKYACALCVAQRSAGGRGAISALHKVFSGCAHFFSLDFFLIQNSTYIYIYTCAEHLEQFSIVICWVKPSMPDHGGHFQAWHFAKNSYFSSRSANE